MVHASRARVVVVACTLLSSGGGGSSGCNTLTSAIVWLSIIKFKLARFQQGHAITELRSMIELSIIIEGIPASVRVKQLDNIQISPARVAS